MDSELEFIINAVRSQRGVDQAGTPMGLQAYIASVSQVLSRATSQRGAPTKPSDFAIGATFNEQALNPAITNSAPHMRHAIGQVASNDERNLQSEKVEYLGQRRFTTALKDNGRIAVDIYSTIPLEQNDLTQVQRATRILCDKLEDQCGTLRASLGSDEVTGLAKKRAIDVYISSHFARSNKPLAVYFIDLLGLKAFNDSLGRPVGNMAINRVASTLIETTREYFGEQEYMVTRDGGDEFLVIHPFRKDLEPSYFSGLVRNKISRTLDVSADENDTGEDLEIMPRVSMGISVINGPFDVRRGIGTAESRMLVDKKHQQALFTLVNPGFELASDGRMKYVGTH